MLLYVVDVTVFVVGDMPRPGVSEILLALAHPAGLRPGLLSVWVGIMERGLAVAQIGRELVGHARVVYMMVLSTEMGYGLIEDLMVLSVLIFELDSSSEAQ